MEMPGITGKQSNPRSKWNSFGTQPPSLVTGRRTSLSPAKHPTERFTLESDPGWVRDLAFGGAHTSANRIACAHVSSAPRAFMITGAFNKILDWVFARTTVSSAQ
jgi:hypothetical protein